VHHPKTPLPLHDRRAAIVLLALIVLCALAQILNSCARNSGAAELILHGPSYHFDRDAGYNRANFGAGYAFDNKFVVGTYHNSEYRPSVYAGRLFPFNEHFSVLAGAVTGYQHAITPAAVAVFTVPIEKNWRLHINVVPFKDGFINLALGMRMPPP